MGVGRRNWMFQFHFVLFLEEVFFFFFSSAWVLVTARCCVVRSHQHPAVAAGVCLRVYVVCMRVCAVYAQFIPAFFFGLFLASLPLSPCSNAFVLHSIMPLLQSGVEKRESGNFIIITSHFCNLYAMRTPHACSYNQVCRNHVRCFTNSWGDGSLSVSDAFPCC